MANKVREWLNKNSAPVTILAIFLLIFALGAIVWQMKPRTYEYTPVDVWYFDLNTGKLFTAKSDMIPPIETESGRLETGMPSGVRAYVFACGGCEQGEQFIGWLEMYTPDAKQALENPYPAEMGEGEEEPSPEDYIMMMEMSWEEGHLIKAGEIEVEPELKDAWVQQNSEKGFEIMQKVQERCGEGRIPEPCLPEGNRS